MFCEHPFILCVRRTKLTIKLTNAINGKVKAADSPEVNYVSFKRKQIEFITEKLINQFTQRGKTKRRILPFSSKISQLNPNQSTNELFTVLSYEKT